MTTDVQPETTTVDLPPDALACIDCGVPVTLDAVGAKPIVVTTTKALARTVVDVEVLRCGACQQVSDVATAAIERMPLLAAKMGTEGAAHRLSSALLALVLLGRPVPDDLSDRAAVMSLIRHLSIPGASARWVTRLAPVLTVSPTACGTAPWSHVSEELLSTARSAYAAMLAERVAAKAPPVVLAPPNAPDPDLARGCLYCGVGALAVAADEAARAGGTESARWIAWQPISILTPSSIGAPASAEPVRGWLCPRCAAVVEDMAVVGQSSMEKALRAHLAEVGRTDDLRRITGGELSQLASWAGFVLLQRRRGRPVPRPNREPWGHLVIA
jgi:hypothetical protein